MGDVAAESHFAVIQPLVIRDHEETGQPAGQGRVLGTGPGHFL
jgi:hypothetical protein